MTSHKDARSDAAYMAENFLDEIVEQLIDKGEASDDFNNDYSGGDAYHHESHVDKWYNLKDAAEILDTFSDCEETDSGLWEGQEPREAISTQAAFTYGNAVASEWSDLIRDINSRVDDLSEELEAIEETRGTKEDRFNELTDIERDLTTDEETELASIEHFDDEATAAKTVIIKQAVEDVIAEYKD